MYSCLVVSLLLCCILCILFSIANSYKKRPFISIFTFTLNIRLAVTRKESSRFYRMYIYIFLYQGIKYCVAAKRRIHGWRLNKKKNEHIKVIQKKTCHAIRNGLLLRYIEMLRREASRKVIVPSHSLANRTIANIIL